MRGRTGGRAHPRYPPAAGGGKLSLQEAPFSVSPSSPRGDRVPTPRAGRERDQDHGGPCSDTTLPVCACGPRNQGRKV